MPESPLPSADAPLVGGDCKLPLALGLALLCVSGAVDGALAPVAFALASFSADDEPFELDEARPTTFDCVTTFSSRPSAVRMCVMTQSRARLATSESGSRKYVYIE